MHRGLDEGFRHAAVLLAVLLAAASVQANDLAPLSDEFEDAATLGDWQRVNDVEQWSADQLEAYDIDTSEPGAMMMMPYSSGWFQDFRGVMAFKEVSGDFVATTHARPTNRAGTGAPGRQFSLSGILVRIARDVTPATWLPGGENYIFLSLGAASSPGSFQFEVKTTQDSVSVLDISGGPSEATIQIAKLGDAFITLRRPPSGPWAVHRRYSRSDMATAGTLQVGLTAYTDWPSISGLDPFVQNSTVITDGNPDLTARFDFMRFHRPTVPVELQGLDLSDPNEVSDAALLAFLGDAVASPAATPTLTPSPATTPTPTATATPPPAPTPTSTPLGVCGSAPLPSELCRQSEPGRSKVTVKDKDKDSRDNFQWAWKRGAATTLDAFADPVNGSASYILCAYDAAGPFSTVTVPAGGTCGTRDCWSRAGSKGFKFKDKAGTFGGVTQIKLRSGDQGRATVQVKAKGENVVLPALPAPLPVTVELRIVDGETVECFQTSFSTAKKNDADRGVLTAKGP